MGGSEEEGGVVVAFEVLDAWPRSACRGSFFGSDMVVFLVVRVDVALGF